MMRIFLLITFINVIVALYGPKSDVFQATDADFKTEVLKHPGIVIVEFYAPWCGHCKSLAPEYEKAASLLKGVVKVVAVDATVHQQVASKYQVQGFPTIKVFGADKKSPTDYQGAREASAIVSEGMRLVNALVKERTGGGKKEKKEKASSSEKGGAKGEKESKKSKSNVIELTDTNFDALVMESNDHWMVEFFAPWCGHCKKLAPEWEKAANRLASEGVKVGAVDATVATGLAQRYGIKGFPSIKLFPGGPKGEPKDYQGAREADAIVEYALQTLESTGAPVPIREITSPDVFSSSCAGKGGAKLCAILFLPHILDTGAKGRNDYLELFNSIAKSLRKMPFAYLWTETNAQSDLENALSINGNVPTVAVVSLEKNIYSVMKLSWNQKNIQTFLNAAITGGEKTSKLSSKPSINSIAPWDGKDGVVQTDEIPLSELFGEGEL